ncbi:hypothetical protein [Thiobacillus sp.]|jgi:membrane protein implicated in regulation of membrane protease activity|uniref:hypothetical protein n=1 Tax=Thiobacillus sp. TaxID=924 RepID=UPI0025FD2717|nr:hypothetical protein [Thiobacillus sp.]
MMLAYLISLALGIAVFFIAGNLSMPVRLGLSLGIFLVLVVAITVVLTRVGDRAPADAITIDPKQLQQGKTEEKLK